MRIVGAIPMALANCLTHGRALRVVRSIHWDALECRYDGVIASERGLEGFAIDLAGRESVSVGNQMRSKAEERSGANEVEHPYVGHANAILNAESVRSLVVVVLHIARPTKS